MPRLSRAESKHTRGSATGAFTLAAAMAVGTAADASAQTREGQFISFGLGGGFDQISCEVCSGTPKSGLAGFVRFGGTVSDRLLLAAEFDAWTKGEEGVRQILGSLTAVALLYADPEARVHVKLGAGAVGYRASEDGDDLTALTPGVIAGLGYDYPIGETLSLSPFANLVVAPFATLKADGDPAVSGATLAMLTGGLSLTWH
ncbi:MAG: hypothetical protein MJB57_14920 [Gemmatimonadetes bacterium]|nr:hypothetical protein [Gemmatimonadota bacterium]